MYDKGESGGAQVRNAEDRGHGEPASGRGDWEGGGYIQPKVQRESACKAEKSSTSAGLYRQSRLIHSVIITHILCQDPLELRNEYREDELQ